MKVLQVGSGLSGWAGIERYVVHLVAGLEGRGHQVTTTVAPGSALEKALTTRTIPIPMKRKHDLRVMGSYIRLLRSESFDVIHVHFNPDFLVAACAARLVSKTPVVMTRHVALPWARVKALYFSYLYDRIIPVSDATRRTLFTSGISESKMSMAKAGSPVVSPPKDVDSLKLELGLGSGFQVGYFGRLSPEKGVAVLLDSVPLLDSDVCINVFGDGPLKEQVVKMESSRLKYHGFRQDVTNCMAVMDALVIPSIWEEAFPYSVLEGMSVGRPIVASSIGGLPELVQNDVNGLLVAPGDGQILASALNCLAADPGRALALGEVGRRVQRAEYTVEKMAERIEGVYRDVLTARR